MQKQVRGRSGDAPSPTAALFAVEPRADDAQVVVAGAVRVTVLTDRLLRIEHAADGCFEDRPTLTVVNRRFPAVPFRSRRDGDSLVVDTGPVRLEVDDVTRPFHPRRVRARIGDGDRTVTWTFGKVDRGNLGGTVRTLDGWKGRCTPRVVGFDPVTGFEREWDEQTLGEGLLSRDGWTVVDDTGTVVLDPGDGTGRPWPTARPDGERCDLYLFAHGDDRSGALAAGARLVGPQPLPPRYAFGYWYSRYYPYTDREVDELVDQLAQHRIPTDVFVIDMDWHRPGWTGYSWDHTLFPDPTATLARLHERGLKVCLNLHPADGVGRHEDAFEAMCRATGHDPATTERVPFDSVDPRFVDAYFSLLHHPEEDRGVDFWWMDWQQGTESALPGLDPLAWLNHLHHRDLVERRPDRRPLLFSRWSGLGAGRHPVGFSGDTVAVWESLAFQPEVTATAANVLYGYWSHDIGGHYGADPDPELYTRWLQFGAHSPVLRTHGTLGLTEERRVWEYPNPYRDVMIATIRHRYELVPHLYGVCRRGVDTGRSLVAPMHHAHPTLAAAHRAPGQYLLGDDLIVAPVVTPRDDDGTAEVRVWLPPGEHLDVAHGRRHVVDAPGGRWVTGRYLLDEVPVFARAGAVVVGQRGVDRLDAPCYPNLVLTAYPGSGRGEVYEDDGETLGYLDGRSVTIALEQRTTARTRTLRLAPAVGTYPGWSSARDVEVRFAAEAPPAGATVDGAEVPWRFDAEAASVVVDLPALDLRAGATVALRRAGGARRAQAEALLDGFPGLSRRVRALADDTRTLIGDDNRRLLALARTAERVSARPDTLDVEVAALYEGIAGLRRTFTAHQARAREIETLNPDRPPRQSEALARAQRFLATTRRAFPPPRPDRGRGGRR